MISTFFPLVDFLYIYQLQEYNTVKFLSWLQNNWLKRNFIRKESINWTTKALLLFIISLVLIALASIYIGFLFKDFALIAIIISMVFFTQVSFLFLLGTRFLLFVPEIFVKAVIVKSATNRLSKLKKLTVIGITGSAGKTSTKEILSTLLSQKFNVVKTPKSFNTALGLAKIINGQINDSTQVFIAELGAYRKGDISTLTKIVNPKIGIITAINPQHLETFGSLEKIIEGKFELIKALPKNGTAVLNGDNNLIRTRAKRFSVKKIFYSIEKKSDLWANNIKIGKKGTEFTLNYNRVQESLKTPLLGKHQVSNMLAAITVCLELGVNLKEIKKASEYILQVPHRLQIISDKNDIIVINDTYNANFEGVIYALEALSQFDSYRKILVTHGMVELGKLERQAHEDLGEKAGQSCNWIILVGKKRGEMILNGLRKTNFDFGKALIVENQSEVETSLSKILVPKSVVLFQNELPDSYK